MQCCLEIDESKSPSIAGACRELAIALRAINFFQTSSLATESAEVEQFGAAHFRRAHFFNAVNHAAVDGEDALHALAEAHLADGEAAVRAVALGDDDAFKRLQAFFVALFDSYLDADRVSGGERGKVSALKFGGKPLHDGMNGHGSVLSRLVF